MNVSTVRDPSLRRGTPTLPPAPAGWRVGCDVVDVARLRERLARTPALHDRLFAPSELRDARRGGVTPGSDAEAQRLAARLAAKEAAYKAFATPGLRFRDVVVVLDTDGAPSLLLHGHPTPASVSLSHDGGLALAVVLAPSASSPPPALTPSSVPDANGSNP